MTWEWVAFTGVVGVLVVLVVAVIAGAARPRGGADVRSSLRDVPEPPRFESSRTVLKGGDDE